MNMEMQNIILIFLDENGEPIVLGGFDDNELDKAHREIVNEKIWKKAHEKAEKDKIPLLKALKITIKRGGYIPEVIKHKP